MRTYIALLGFVLVGLLLWHEESPPVMGPKFDFGDNPTAAADDSPGSKSAGPMGATADSEPPVIASTDDVIAAGGGSAFPEVPIPKDEVIPARKEEPKAAPKEDPPAPPVPEFKNSDLYSAAPQPSAFEDVVKEPVEEEKKPMSSAKPPEPSAFSDIKPEPEGPKGPVAKACCGNDKPKWIDNVFPIQNNTNHYAGCAIAIRPDMLLAPFHVIHYGQTQVGVNGQWVNAQASYPPGADERINDGAILKVPGGQFPSLGVRSPVYYEGVTLYGLKTKTAMRGFISGSRQVSVMPEFEGVKSGDSGGIVIADDGYVVGMISGAEPGNDRSVYIVRMDLFLPYIPRSGPVAGTENKEAVPKPVGSVFPNQPSAFDDVMKPKQPQQVQQPQQQTTIQYYQNGQQYQVTPRRGKIRWRQ